MSDYLSADPLLLKVQTFVEPKDIQHQGWIKDDTMQLTIQGIGIKITDALNDFVNDKFKKLDRKADLVNSITVTLTVDKLAQIAKADIDVKGNNLHAEAQSEDMYAAIDALLDKVDRLIVKNKEKVKQE